MCLQVQEAEQRLEYGLHYGIPYPRLHHASQFPRRYTLTAPQVEPSALPQSKRVPSPHRSKNPPGLLCDSTVHVLVTKRPSHLQ